MVQAAQLALDDALEAGGVPGIRLELWTLNDKGNEREGVRIAHQITKDERVLGAVGHYNSNVTLQTAPIYYEGGLPLVSPIVSNPKLTESGWSNIFRFTNRDDATAAALVGYLMQQLGKRRVIVVETDTVYGHSMTEEFVQAFQRNSGRVLARLQVPEGRTEFDGMVRSYGRKTSIWPSMAARLRERRFCRPCVASAYISCWQPAMGVGMWRISSTRRAVPPSRARVCWCCRPARKSARCRAPAISRNATGRNTAPSLTTPRLPMTRPPC